MTSSVYDLALVYVALQFVSTPGLFMKSSLLGIPVVNSVYWYSDLTKFFIYDTIISPAYHFFSSFLFLACGEPPLCLSCSVLFAVKRAIENARSEIGKDELFVLCK